MPCIGASSSISPNRLPFLRQLVTRDPAQCLSFYIWVKRVNSCGVSFLHKGAMYFFFFNEVVIFTVKWRLL